MSRSRRENVPQGCPGCPACESDPARKAPTVEEFEDLLDDPTCGDTRELVGSEQDDEDTYRARVENK